MNVAVLTPAYGKDYVTEKQVSEAYNQEKDFILENVLDHYCGKPCNKSDLMTMSEYTHVKLRYAKKTELVILKVNGDAIDECTA